MIYEIAKETGAALKTAGVHLPVEYGRLHYSEAWPSKDRAILWQEGSDRWLDARQARQRGPSEGQALWTRAVSVRGVIEGVSRKPAAREEDHVRLVEHLLERFVEHLTITARARQNQIDLAGSFVMPDDHTAREIGARYAFELYVYRSVNATPPKTVRDGVADPSPVGVDITITAPGLDDAEEHCGAAA